MFAMPLVVLVFFGVPLSAPALAPYPPIYSQVPRPSVGAAAIDNRCEKQVRIYEKLDYTTPPPKGVNLLVGDSQFFRWKTLAEDLPGYTIINRGIDSFQFSDLLNFYDSLVLLYQPRMIVLHIGGNDVHNGKSPERVPKDFKTFVAKVRTIQPKVPIAFSSLTPGPGRWDEADKRKQTNALIQAYVASQTNLHFIDLWAAMLLPNGQQREDLWVADRVHPNHDGYLVRVKIMRQLLGKPDKQAAKKRFHPGCICSETSSSKKQTA